jgi:mpaB/rubber oxygenase-like protein
MTQNERLPSTDGQRATSHLAARAPTGETAEPRSAQHDHQAIVHRIACYEFPFDFTRSLELALFRTFCVPSISRLLQYSGEFEARPQKRYDDTDLLVSEVVEHGYDSERGAAAIARINALHGRFKIANGDFLYVLSSFVYEPIRWIDRYGRRPLSDVEKESLCLFWCEVGRRMNIADIPADYESFRLFNLDYERTHFRYSESNKRIGIATREMFVSWYPRLLAPCVRQAIYALMDEPLRRSFGFDDPAPFFARLVPAMLRWRGRFTALLPRRRHPRLRTRMRHRSYRDGYEIERLGPT